VGSNPDISQKFKMADISKGITRKLYPPNKYEKNPWGIRADSVLDFREEDLTRRFQDSFIVY
jgi:hypothetical protein